jgi:hypothetical protein
MRRIVAVGLALTALIGLTATGTASAEAGSCARGQFCWWPNEGYRGALHALELATTDPGECVPLPAQARSFVNRMSRPVTVYQGGECGTEGEFDTYPGGGTFVPVAPYLVRAVQVWER